MGARELIVVGLLLLAGCTTLPLTEANTTIVLAKKVEKDKGASDVSDVFTFEGNIYVYVTFRWEPVTQEGGPHVIEARWFNGSKEISRREYRANFGRPPHFVWLATRGTALGPGQCRVEVYADGKRVGERAFRVVEKSS